MKDLSMFQLAGITRVFSLPREKPGAWVGAILVN